MRLLTQTTRVAQLSLLIAIVPVVLALLLAFAPDSPSTIVRLSDLGTVVCSWWWWVWAPTYLIAKGLFFANCAKKNQSEVRAAAPWVIAINVALLLQFVAIALLGSRFGQ
jgi:hypothetical protein